ncbi:glycosyltransferase family 2 protein, partial [Streptomyces sp. NPDC001675]
MNRPPSGGASDGRTTVVTGGAPDCRTTVVLITHDRRDELLRTLTRLRRLPERPRLIVTDNASSDGTAEAVARHFPEATLLCPGRNLGAVGRNLAVRHVRTPYVAFCDDDSWWEAGSLRLAADLLDARPRLAGVTARIVVQPEGTEDPVVRELRESPLSGPGWLPGPALGSFLAAATVLRTDAFRAGGGFHPGLWLGGEEELLACDLLRQGWWLAYAEELTVHHQASRQRDSTARRVLGIRNTLWFTWLRLRRRRTTSRARPTPRRGRTRSTAPTTTTGRRP